MKKLQLLISIILISITSYSQKVETKYFDKLGNEVKESWAIFEERTMTYDDSRMKIYFFRIDDNTLISKQQYKNGHPVGVWVLNDKKGDLISMRNFDRIVYADSNSIKREDTIIVAGEYVPPTYGKEGDRLIYLMENVHYPKEAKKSRAQGIVYIRFLVSKEGKMSNVVIKKGVSPYLDFEAYRVISGMGNWNPATVDGNPIDDYYDFPIKFILNY